MKKMIIAILALAIVTVSCENSNTNKKTEAITEEVVVEEVVEIDLVDFEDKVEGLVGKTVVVEGTIDHVCKHGGQRMFLIDTGSEGRVKVTPDENVAAFKTDLEGQAVILTGIVEEMRIDEEYLKEWEEEILSEADMGDDKGEGSHLGGDMEKGGEDADKAEEMEKVNKLRQEISETEKGYLSYYSILCTAYEVVETEAAPE